MRTSFHETEMHTPAKLQRITFTSETILERNSGWLQHLPKWHVNQRNYTSHGLSKPVCLRCSRLVHIKRGLWSEPWEQLPANQTVLGSVLKSRNSGWVPPFIFPMEDVWLHLMHSVQPHQQLNIHCWFMCYILSCLEHRNTCKTPGWECGNRMER